MATRKKIRKLTGVKKAKTDPRIGNWKRRGIEFTPEQYDDLLNEQGGVCAVCKRPPGAKRLAVDHDHSTGRVRGLTCFRCNKFIIGRHRTPDLLQAGADYLRRHLQKYAA